MPVKYTDLGNVPTILYSDNQPIALVDPLTGATWGLTESMSLASFLALNLATLADKTQIHINDLHGPTGVGGSLVVWDSVGYKWAQITAPVVFSSLTAAVASFPAASYSGWRIKTSDYGLNYESDGTEYRLVHGQAILYRDYSLQPTLIAPAATFTATTPSSAAAGADTLLTSAGAHGLTTAVAITARATYIYISGGTGWTVGFHKITAIAVDTTGTTIQIDTPYDAGFGTPTIALAGTEVTMLSLNTPIMATRGELELDISFNAPSNANNKTMKVKLGGTTFYDPVLTNATNSGNNRALFVLSNRNAVNSQIAGQGHLTNVGVGSSSSSINTGTVDTSAASTLAVTMTIATANDYFGIDRYNVRYRT